ncbi:hypothetical protein [Rheinheimera sp. 1928-s]|uniref:hypothetical protein n=1 Tax=Rheinheimera sp. 1928-s TaxID=3033803 RepID=UPI00261FA7EE|nr:hypothetical protein [Rheinheimera sp. 1928-s]MDF3123831.1 hypothetical protein [Rheinheimera sp. 1928-s]
MKPKVPSSFWLLAAGLLCALLLTVILAYFTATEKLSAALEQQLPAVVNKALEDNHGFQQKVVPYLLEQLNADLSGISLQPGSVLINRCAVTLFQIGEGAAPDSSRTMQWLSGTHPRFARFEIHCVLNTAGISVASAVILLFLLVSAWLIPAPVSLQRERYITKALQSGCSMAEALTLTQPLQAVVTAERLGFLEQLLEQHFSFADAMALAFCSSEYWDPDCDLQWLKLGWHIYPADCRRAFQIAKAPALLEFQLSRSSVMVHGVTIELPRTPLLYYYWYAIQRVQTAEGWVLNPASNKPDLVLAQDISQLMEQWQGHKKAIQDLQEQGLKAKTLDQNRSKIRDELVSVLGAELAHPYLFDSQKSVRTGRFSYRLMTAPDSVLLGQTNSSEPDRDISEMPVVI